MKAYGFRVETEELRLFRDTFKHFLKREVVPNMEQWRKQGMIAREVWESAGEAGFLLASCPERLGGVGGNYRHEAIMIEELARIGFADFNIHLHNAVVAPYLYHFGTAPQQSRWLPRLRTGKLIGAMAMTEPSAGSDLKAIRTYARREGDDFIISGQKTFISNGHLANFIIVACKTNPDSSVKGISLLAVETDEVTGLQRGNKLQKVGWHAQDTSELYFDNVRVPAANLIGQLGKGFDQMMELLPQERLNVAILAISVIEIALEVTLKYVKERRAFGKTLFEHQNTRFVLADAQTKAVIGRIFVDQCIDELLRGELDPAKAAMAKLWLAEQQGRIVDECLQLFGGYGYMLEYPIARMWTDARLQRIYGGSNEIMKEIIARSM